MAANLLFLGIIYGVGVVVLIHVSQTLVLAGRKANQTTTARNLTIGLWVWAILATIYALIAGDGFLWLAPTVILPLTLIVGLTFAPAVVALLRHISLPRLVGVKSIGSPGRSS